MEQPSGFMTTEQLIDFVKKGQIETVMVQMIDLYGRPLGKLFDADFFVENAMQHGHHVCNYFLTVDMPMNVVEGFKGCFNWNAGYGDLHCVPDLRTLRYCAWREQTAVVQCDVRHKDGSVVAVSPRAILRGQIAALEVDGIKANVASELEYFMFRETYRGAHLKKHTDLESFGQYVEDYHILQGSRSEFYHRDCRRALKQSGIKVETTKGEAACGQHELNVKYNEALAMADDHSLLKQCLKELADKNGIAVTFMAKPNAEEPGSSCHIHCSLSASDGSNAFVGEGELGCVKGVSPLFEHFLAGWMKYTPDCMPFYAPTVNSYKRYQSKSWAPTSLVWAVDNRTAGFRVVGSGTKDVRIEMRLPGADCNPYLAFAAVLASGAAGVREKLKAPAPFDGDAYRTENVPTIPLTLKDALCNFERSDFAKEAFGADVVEHYATFFQNEVTQFEQAVTDWERQRYFEQV